MAALPPSLVAKPPRLPQGSLGTGATGRERRGKESVHDGHEWGVMAGDLPGGREAAFTALFEGSYLRVLRYCRRRIDPESARDVTAEVFLVAWRRWDDVPVNALPWLYGVARRAIANDHRAKERLGRLEERIAEELSRPQVDAPGDQEFVYRALATLSTTDQEILRLSAWEQLNASEIAVVLGCLPGAAAVRLHRARRRLERSLSALDGASLKSSLASAALEKKA